MDFNITYRKKDGGIQAIISYKDINGKWKQKSKQGFEDSKKGEKLAANWANDTITELKNNGVVNRQYENITFKEFYDLFIYDRTNSLSEASLNCYSNSIKHFKDLYNLKLKDIKTIDVQREVNKINLNSSTIEAYIKKIKCLFNFAINKYEIIAKNPVKNIEYEISKSKEKTALNSLELEKLLTDLKKLRSYNYYISSLLAAKCGLRIGEICGLTWNNIDFVTRKITIDKQWKKDKTKSWGFGKPKSINSYRKVPMPLIVIKELMILKQTHPINIDNRLLNINNTMAFSSNLIDRYNKYGFNISIHELRHTYATNLIAAGVDFKTAAKLLGHDIEQTMKTYTHVNDDMLNNAQNIIDNFF